MRCDVDFIAFFSSFPNLSRLGIRKEDLPKYEEQLELKIAKAQLEELKKDTLEAMETQKKRYVDACWQSYSNHFFSLKVNFWQTILGLLDDWEIKISGNSLWALTLASEKIQSDPFVDFDK